MWSIKCSETATNPGNRNFWAALNMAHHPCPHGTACERSGHVASAATPWLKDLHLATSKNNNCDDETSDGDEAKNFDGWLKCVFFYLFSLGINDKFSTRWHHGFNSTYLSKCYSAILYCPISCVIVDHRPCWQSLGCRNHGSCLISVEW